MARRFSRQELERFVGVSVPDLAAPGMRLAFVGINPGLWTAATQTHFAYPGNRFYPALHAGGLTSYLVDVHEGMDADDHAYFVGRGIGITNLVDRATARADELGKDELVTGGERLVSFVERWQPKVVAVLGITAYRTAFRLPGASRGLQEEPIAGAEVHVLGNPSGLNAHETVDSLADAFAAVAARAGLAPDR
jgi:TDG/mug DNA glycosylase family protein